MRTSQVQEWRDEVKEKKDDKVKGCLGANEMQVRVGKGRSQVRLKKDHN